MSDLIDELRLLQRSGKGYHTRRIAGQGADEIERLERELAEARGLLRRVVDEVPLWDEGVNAGELGNAIERSLAATEVPK